MFRSLCASFALLFAISVFGQAPAAQKFEVATVKLTDPNFGGILIQLPGGTLSLRGFTLVDLIAFAYDVDNRQVFSVPKALESERYDVVGKAEKPLTMASTETKPMVQALLAERFQLKIHRETREIPIYVMTVAKGGHKMKARTAGDDGPPTSLLFRGANVPGRNATMAMLAGGLQKLVLDRPVIDKTGLTGNYDFDLSWRPDGTQFGGRGGTLPAASDPDRADIFTALQEQLGLKLEAQKGPGEVVVVDKAEKPSEN
jgi:bla regulator protein blaR1